jgi:FtsP/CotA-like multicopper oxidase with cupredoxin domain
MTHSAKRFAPLLLVVSLLVPGSLVPDALAAHPMAPPSASPKPATKASPSHAAKMRNVRRYFVAAEPIAWSYAPSGRDKLNDQLLPRPWRDNPTYAKYHFVGYTDDTFTHKSDAPPWLGILGPTLHAIVGERLIVTLLNRTDRVVSLHPHGLRYDKDSEGAFYGAPGKGSWVIPNQRFEYIWDADEDSGPAPGEASSKVWLYHSHVMSDEDINAGLVGAIVVTDRAHARPDGTPKDVDREFITLYMIFNEVGYLQPEAENGAEDDNDDVALRTKREAFRKLNAAAQRQFLAGGMKHAINGYIFGNLPPMEMNDGERVRWYVLALGSEQDLHSAHWHGKTVLEDGRRRTDDIELLPGSMKVADMRADNPGTWLLHCHVSDHMMSGMYGYFVIHPASH